MKIPILRGIVAALATSVFAGQAIANAASHKVHTVSTATLNSDSGGDPGTCDPATFLAKAGDPVCVASLSQVYNSTGDFEGNEFLEITYAQFANGNFANTGDFQTWTGTIDGVGTGSFVVNEYDLVFKSDGTYHSNLRVVDGTGTGDFTLVTGQGRSKSGPLQRKTKKRGAR
jgi:Protein of unknown function (DUF3224)